MGWDPKTWDRSGEIGQTIGPCLRRCHDPRVDWVRPDIPAVRPPCDVLCNLFKGGGE